MCGCPDCQCSVIGKITLNSSPLAIRVPDLVNFPLHYTEGKAKCSCGRTIECIDITRHLNFNLGNAIKYIWRCDLKGNSIEDLKKAVFYLNDEIQKRGGEE